MSGVTGVSGPARPYQAPPPPRLPATQPGTQPLASANSQPSWTDRLAAILAVREQQKAAKKLKKVQKAALGVAATIGRAGQPAAAAAGGSAAPAATAANANAYDEGEGLGDGVEDESFQAFSTEDLEAAGTASAGTASAGATARTSPACRLSAAPIPLRAWLAPPPAVLYMPHNALRTLRSQLGCSAPNVRLRPTPASAPVSSSQACGLTQTRSQRRALSVPFRCRPAPTRAHSPRPCSPVSRAAAVTTTSCSGSRGPKRKRCSSPPSALAPSLGSCALCRTWLHASQPAPHPPVPLSRGSCAFTSRPPPTSTPPGGKLSAAQFKALQLACARHETRLPDGSRAGFFLGDGGQRP
jgi:hypothetical protein